VAFRKRFYLLLLVLTILLSGCTNSEATDGRNVSSVESDQSEHTTSEHSIPPGVFHALAKYTFYEFKQGRIPTDLIWAESDKTYAFFVGREEQLQRSSVLWDDVQFDSILDWFRAHPDTDVKSIEMSPGSTDKRVVMNIESSDGFYARVSFVDYELRAFFIFEDPIPWE